MYDLAGTQFEKGTLEFRLEKRLAPPLGLVVNLGPIKGRLVAMCLLLSTAFLTFKKQPVTWLIEHGWLYQGPTALQVQGAITWTLFFAAILIYAFIYTLRSEKLVLSFDKTKGMLRYVLIPKFLQKPEDRGLIPFSKIDTFKVYSKDREPRTPHGFVEIGGDAGGEAKVFRFMLLSEDQFRIYPTNISRIIGRPATGDWSDPDDEIIGQKNTLELGKL
jgi:hypothetical protein